MVMLSNKGLRKAGGDIPDYDLPTMELAVKCSNLGVWDYRPETGSLFWSDELKKMMGLSAGESVDFDSFRESVHPADRWEVDRRVQNALAGDNDGSYSVRYRTCSGGRGPSRKMYVKGRVCFDEHGLPVRFSGVALDVTQIEDDDQDFLTWLAHDLREPLRTIRSFLKLTRAREISAVKRDEFLNFALEGANLLSSRIGAVSELVRAGCVPMQLQRCEASVAVNRALASLNALIEESKAEIIVGILPFVTADAALLEVVFQHILANALEQRSSGPPRIEVTARRKENSFVFSISDRSEAFPPENADRVFRPFQRRSRGAVSGEAGAGLSVCRKIVERHGGEIWASSRPELGTTVSFSAGGRALNFSRIRRVVVAG